MSTQVKRRRGTSAEHASFTGSSGEITIDTDTWEPVVHDGITRGGHRQGNDFPAGITIGGVLLSVVNGKLEIQAEVVAPDFGRTT